MELLDQPLVIEARTRQLAYGYMKIPRDIEDEKVRVMEIRLRAFADQLGLTFCRFFYEFNCGSTAAFDDLIEELNRTGARYVVVPTLRHFAVHPLLQDMLVCRLRFQAQAEVFDLSER